MILIAVFILLQALDGYTTWRILSAGGRELHPVVAALIKVFGLVAGLMLAKGLAIGLVLYFELPDLLLAIFCIGYAWVVWHNWRQMR